MSDIDYQLNKLAQEVDFLIKKQGLKIEKLGYVTDVLRETNINYSLSRIQNKVAEIKEFLK